MNFLKRSFVVSLTGLALVFSLASAASAQTYSEEATLTDGVDGIDVQRSTTINARVWAIENVGEHMLVGGAFLNVRDRSSYASIPRPYLAAFDPNSGEYVPEFLAQPNGTVYDVIEHNGDALLLGEFSSVNSTAGTHGVALIDGVTGEVDTSLSVALSTNGVIRSGAIDGNFLYLGGSFSSIQVGGVQLPLTGLARVNLNTKQLDSSFVPSVEGAGRVWGIDVASDGTVFAGGYFDSINETDGTETFAALNSDGSLVAGWNHGFPFAHRNCNLAWSQNCGAVNDLAVYGDKVFVAGAKHYWTAHNTSDGALLADKLISNDGQRVEVIGDKIAIGCHCSHSNSDEFFGVTDRYLRIIDPILLTEVESPTVNSEGGAGGWAAGLDPRGCFWGGGEFSSTNVGGTQHPAWNLLRFCPDGVGSTTSARPARVVTDFVPPASPTGLQVSQRASTVELTWTSNDSNVGYLILRDGEIVARTSGTTYEDRFVTPGVHYWQVAAFDMAGNVSASSATSAPIEIAQLVNVASGATATQLNDWSPDTVASNAIDGNTDPVLANGSVARTSTGSAWFNLDLGQSYDVDYLEIFPSDNYGELNNRIRIYRGNDPITAATRVEAAEAGLKVWTGPRLGEGPRIEKADLAENMRYIRLIGNRVSLAEIRVFTTPVLPTPAQPAQDTEAPSVPGWKSIKAEVNSSLLRWGASPDNRGTVYYEVYRKADATLIGRTIDRSIVLAGTGLKASDFEIVAFDAAGLDSGNTPQLIDPISISACEAVRDGQDVDITWTSTDDPDRFIIRRSVDGSAQFWRAAPLGSSRSFTDSDRNGNIRYFIEAKLGVETVSDLECTVTNEAPPAGDLISSCSAVRNGQTVEISWVSDSAPDKFIVRRSVNGSAAYWRGSTSGTTLQFSDSDRTGDLSYKVEAKIGNNVAAFEDCSADDENPIGSAPEGLRHTFVDRSRIVLNWQSTGAIEIEVDGQIVATDSDGWHVLLGRTPGTTYSIRIRFVGSNNWSEAISVTTNV